MRIFFHTGLQLAFMPSHKDVMTDLVETTRIGLRVLADEQSER